MNTEVIEFIKDRLPEQFNKINSDFELMLQTPIEERHKMNFNFLADSYYKQFENIEEGESNILYMYANNLIYEWTKGEKIKEAKAKFESLIGKRIEIKGMIKSENYTITGIDYEKNIAEAVKKTGSKTTYIIPLTTLETVTA